MKSKKTTKQKDKQVVEFDINKLIVKTHNKIALWNTSDIAVEEKSVALKTLSHEIVTDILTEAFSELNGVKTYEKIIFPENNKENKK
jgi:hypothetical protein